MVNRYWNLRNVGCEEAKQTFDNIAAGKYRATPGEPGKLYVENYMLCFMDPANERRALSSGSTCLKYGPELENTDVFKGSFTLAPKN